MRRFILVMGATVALAISSVGLVAADDPDPVGACPDDMVLTHDTTFTIGGGGGLIIRLETIDVDRNGDGHACVRTRVIKDGPEHPLVDNNLPFRERIIKPI